jgi:hypothetical protein
MESDGSSPVSSVVPKVEYVRLPDDKFVEEYANNVFMEASVWDLKLIFGKLDQQKGPNSVVQHSSITLPWNYVKALHYLLGINLHVYEILHGKLSIPRGVIAAPVAPTPDQESQFPRAKEAFEYAQKEFRKLVAENPESF